MTKFGMFLIACLLLNATIFSSNWFLTVPSTAASKGQTNSASQYWDFYNSTKIDDPLGDATPGAPSYVDIKSLEIRQIGQHVQFVWEGNGSLYNNDNQYYFIVLDTDLNASTGQNWGGAGGELKIAIYQTATLVYFDEKGNDIKELGNIPVIFEGNRFYLSVEKEKIPADKFNLYLECSGGTPYRDAGSLNLITLQPEREALQILIDSDNIILAEKPRLMNIPYRNTTVKLRTYLVKGESRTELPEGEVVYVVYHPVTWEPQLGEPSSIVSVSQNGVATYLREGYVFVFAYSNQSYIRSEPIIIATGNVYGNPNTDNVIAVFPEDYRPNGSTYTFGDMMESYPDCIKMMNVEYDVMREMYNGYKPFDGDKQILAMFVKLNGDESGGNMNPLETTPGGLMGNGKPQYGVVFHEMGHNFAACKGMATLCYANNSRIGAAGFGEGVASLPIQYLAPDFRKYPEKYGFANGSLEWQWFNTFLEGDIPYSKGQLDNFENMIREGQTKGIFDNNGKFDGVAVFCSLFQQYAYDFTNDTNPYKQEVIRRFLNLFSDRDLPNFEDNKVETYFSACFSAAVGHDLREKLRFWGFSIDEGYYDDIYPQLKEIADASMAKREFYVMLNRQDYTLTIDTNSTITAFAFSEVNKQVSLHVIGNSGEGGYCNVTIPNGLLNGEFFVVKDGSLLTKNLDYTQSYNGTHNTFCFAYIHSTHKIKIIASKIIPEFPSAIILSSFMMLTLLAVIVYRKNRKKSRVTCAF